MRWPSYAFFALLIASGCYESHVGIPHAPTSDAGRPGPDGGGGRDGGGLDGGRFDAAGVDAAGVDAGRADGGGERDAGPPRDAGRPDAGRRDAGPRDGGIPFDTGAPDGGPPSIALRFDSGERLFITPSSLLELTREYTLEMWVRPRGMDGPVSEKGERATGRSHLGIFVESGRVVAGFTASGRTREVSGPIGYGAWTHVALVVTPAGASLELRLLVDGARVDRRVVASDMEDALNDRAWAIGGFEGDVDEIRLWQVARPDGAIRSAMGSRLPRGTPGMEAYLPLEERGQLALDRTLRGHDGVLGNLTTRDAADPSWIADGAVR